MLQVLAMMTSSPIALPNTPKMLRLLQRHHLVVSTKVLFKLKFNGTPPYTYALGIFEFIFVDKLARDKFLVCFSS